MVVRTREEGGLVGEGEKTLVMAEPSIFHLDLISN